MTPARIQVFVPPERELEEDRRILSVHERHRAAEIGSPRARARYVATRARVRRMLGEELGCSPEEIRLAVGGQGRPQIVNARGAHVSISHTEGMAVIAVSSSRPIGVDVERADRVPLPPEGAWLSDVERERLAPLDGSHRHRELIRTWTAKEAVAKGLGTGLTTPLRTIDVEEDVARTSAPYDITWRLRPVDAGPRHVATLAAPVDDTDETDGDRTRLTLRREPALGP